MSVRASLLTSSLFGESYGVSTAVCNVLTTDIVSFVQSPVIEVFEAIEVELNSVKATIKDIAKDIALVRFLKNNFDVHFNNLTQLPKKISLKTFYCTLFQIRK